MFDKFHDECGVFAIFGHPEAAKVANLGLHALQHRGQESAGIASLHDDAIICHKSMGHVADIFTNRVLEELKGDDKEQMEEGHQAIKPGGEQLIFIPKKFGESEAERSKYRQYCQGKIEETIP